MASIETVTPDHLLAHAPGRGEACRRLSASEASFVSAAMELILPEPLHPGMTIDVVGFVERLLAAEAGGDDATVLDQYRRGAAAIQRYCLSARGLPFEQLPVCDQHRVLSMLEDGCPEAGFQEHPGMFRMLILHASQAYFDETWIPLRLDC